MGRRLLERGKKWGGGGFRESLAVKMVTYTGDEGGFPKIW